MAPSILPRTKARLASGRSSLTLLSNDEQRIVLTHVDTTDLLRLACVCKDVGELVGEEKVARRKAQLKAEAIARREKRLARARLFAEAEGDACLIAAVLRHVLAHAPRGYAPRLAETKRLARGVCRLRVGTCRGEHTGLTTDLSRAENVVDALAVQESTLRTISFRGEPLGPAGAAVAVRQARALGLNAEASTELDGHVFKLVFRADVIVDVLSRSPRLQKLVAE